MTTVSCYILHRRNYRESSLLLELFTQEYGRLSILCKGVKKRKDINYCLRPFTELSFELVELGDLWLLKDAERIKQSFNLQGNQIIGGMYINELFYRLLDKRESLPNLYKLYEDTLDAMTCHENFSLYVRQFEYALLTELGYGFDLRVDCKDEKIRQNAFYQFIPTEGFIEIRQFLQKHNVFHGEQLLKIANWELFDNEAKQDCKRLFQLALKPLLGERPLMSAELLKQKKVLLSGAVS